MAFGRVPGIAWLCLQGISQVWHVASQDTAASPRRDATDSPTGLFAAPSLGGDGTDGISRSPQAAAETGTRPGPVESVNRCIRRFGSRAVKEGDKSWAYCY